MKNIPYASATSGDRARSEIENMLIYFGAATVSWITDFETHTTTLGFVYKNRQVQLRASAAGWASMYLKRHPWNSRRKQNKLDYEAGVLQQGLVAINSILRDWLKGQLTAIESGLLQFEHVFLPYMITEHGGTVSDHLDRIQFKLLEASKT